MNPTENTRALILEHFQKYPQMEITDLFKFLHHSSFGCDHMVSDARRCADMIKKEAAHLDVRESASIDRLDGAYSRVHLSYIKEGLNEDTLAKLFCASAKPEKDGRAALHEKLGIAQNLIAEGLLPFDADEFEAANEKWKAADYCALHHSERFRDAYAPSYRVIANKYVPFLPLFAKIDRSLAKGNASVAIEGGSASGKTTLAKILEEIYDCTVFHMDDFFLRPEQRTPKRLSEAGGNIDRERFEEEVLIPLSRGERIAYRIYDCSTGSLLAPVEITPTKLTIIEGAYSMHPELQKYYTLSVFLDISPDKQRERIKKRNSPQMAKRFFDEWIPLEKIYFEAANIKDHCDVIIRI